VRQNPKVVNVFQKLWNKEEVLTSFDGASIHLPPEKTNKGGITVEIGYIPIRVLRILIIFFVYKVG